MHQLRRPAPFALSLLLVPLALAVLHRPGQSQLRTATNDSPRQAASQSTRSSTQSKQPPAHSAPPTQSNLATARSPGGPFINAQAGETLRDVAIRVLGSDTETERLWNVNRDLVQNPAEPLPAGKILRSP
jgi:nucleoid-associated protein YgaU